MVLPARERHLPVVAGSADPGHVFVRHVHLEDRPGAIVPRGDAAALAAGARKLLDDPALRAEMGSNARERAVSRFSVAASAKEFLRYYDDALSTARSTGR